MLSGISFVLLFNRFILPHSRLLLWRPTRLSRSPSTLLSRCWKLPKSSRRQTSFTPTSSPKISFSKDRMSNTKQILWNHILPIVELVYLFSISLWSRYPNCTVQEALVICDHFICDFAYVRLRNGHFPGTYLAVHTVSVRIKCVWISNHKVEVSVSNQFGPLLSLFYIFSEQS